MANDIKVNQEVIVMDGGKYNGREGKVLSVTSKTGYRGTYIYEVIEVDIGGTSVMVKDWQIMRK